MTEVKYISAADTAKLIRKQLKANFSEQKFYVRTSTYAGGASIDIHWMDGPAESSVKYIISAFEGTRFDGMIDMSIPMRSWLNPDGTATLATNGSDGLVPAEHYPAPQPDAELVSFGANFVFTHRAISKGLMQQFLDTEGVTMDIRERSWWPSGKEHEKQQAYAKFRPDDALGYRVQKHFKYTDA